MASSQSGFSDSLLTPSFRNALSAIGNLATFGIVFTGTQYYTLGNGCGNVGNVASIDGLACLQTVSEDDN